MKKASFRAKFKDLKVYSEKVKPELKVEKTGKEKKEDKEDKEEKKGKIDV